MDEKRIYPRIGVSFPVECKALPARNYFYTVSKDLSLGGARILSNEFMAKDDLLKLNINFIDKVLSLKAKVIWCNRDRASERYSTGLEFVEMADKPKEELFGFLNKIFNS